MKKSKNFALGMVCYIFLLSINTQAQEEPKPVLITITTMHRNMDADRTDWKKTEQEYFDKVTSKNNLIMGSEILNHYYTGDSSEILFISVFKSWEDIAKATELTSDLVIKGWPDEKARKAFFDKYNSYYSPVHSDEIYTSVAVGRKEFQNISTEPMIVYMRKSQMSANAQGKGMKEYNEKVTMNDPYIKAYYPQRHSWGADNRDFLEVYYYNSMSDLEKSSDKQNELILTAWPKEKERKAFMDEMSKSFTGIHSDYLYHNVPSLHK